MKLKCLSALLCLVLLVSCFTATPVYADEIVDVTAYSYSVTPILDPFAYYLYVETDNPDPYSFRLIDLSSQFFTDEEFGHISVPMEYGSAYIEVDPGTYYIDQNLYPDVAYENPNIFRVHGGYIFKAENTYSDGGELVLMQKTRSGDSILHDQFVKTDVLIPCSALNTRVGYLVDTFTSPDKSFFENLDAVQTQLNQIAVYPRGVYDSSKPNENTPYPLLAVSPYPELSLNDHYSMFQSCASGMLASKAYPFVLDSLGVPGTMSAVAKELEPECGVTSGSYHAEILVSFHDEIRTYGGAGQGGNDPLYTNRVATAFTFRGDDLLGTQAEIADFCQHLLSYQSVAQKDAEAYRDLVQGETFRETIRATGGTWLQVATEGFFGFGQSYAYAVPRGSSVEILSDAWVDGSYIGQNEAIMVGLTFEDHPTAKIVCHNVTFTDVNGNVHTQDVVYTYDSAYDQWRAPFYYAYNNWYDSSKPLPEELILTREEVNNLGVESWGTHFPEKGLIYDGSEEPGTPFTNVPVSGISVPASMEMFVDQKLNVTATLRPENATIQDVVWTTSHADVVEVVDDTSGYIAAKREGTAVLTVQTLDGGYTAKCTVTVKANPCVNGHVFGPYTSDQNGTCTQDGTKTAKCNVCGITDTVTDTGSVLGHAWSEWTVTEEATEDRDGKKERYCTRCDAKEESCIDKLSSVPEDMFVDVIPGKFYEIPVQWAVENGITNGVDATHFAPDKVCSRGEVVTFLWRASGEPEPTSSYNPFTDVTEGKFYYKAVLWAVENGITKGMSDTTFEPSTQCNRAQVATFLWRALGEPEVKNPNNPFVDAFEGKYYYNAVLWAAENGVTTGIDDSHFAPDNLCNRGQIVTFLYRAFS